MTEKIKSGRGLKKAGMLLLVTGTFGAGAGFLLAAFGITTDQQLHFAPIGPSYLSPMTICWCIPLLARSAVCRQGGHRKGNQRFEIGCAVFASLWDRPIFFFARM